MCGMIECLIPFVRDIRLGSLSKRAFAMRYGNRVESTPYPEIIEKDRQDLDPEGGEICKERVTKAMRNYWRWPVFRSPWHVMDKVPNPMRLYLLGTVKSLSFGVDWDGKLKVLEAKRLWSNRNILSPWVRYKSPQARNLAISQSFFRHMFPLKYINLMEYYILPTTHSSSLS